VSDDGTARLLAWKLELAAAHTRLRGALQTAREALVAGETASVREDLLLHCHGFCSTLGAHHLREDAELFPELAARHPALAPTIAKLAEDHAMIAALLVEFDGALSTDAPAADLLQHLEGLGAIMESHFRFEERELVGLLDPGSSSR
jgi:hypothetical protein